MSLSRRNLTLKMSWKIKRRQRRIVELKNVAQQVFLKFCPLFFSFNLRKFKCFTINFGVLLCAEHVCSVAACFACTAGNGWRFRATTNATANGRDGDAPHGSVWNATNGLLIILVCLTESCNFYMVKLQISNILFLLWLRPNGWLCWVFALFSTSFCLLI